MREIPIYRAVVSVLDGTILQCWQWFHDGDPPVQLAENVIIVDLTAHQYNTFSALSETGGRIIYDLSTQEVRKP